MASEQRYAVMLYDAALRDLGDAVKPYLQPGEFGPYLLCKRIEPGLPFTLLVLDVATPDRGTLQMEVQVPSAIVRLVINVSNHRPLGFTKG
jgi:hypothetical protein